MYADETLKERRGVGLVQESWFKKMLVFLIKYKVIIILTLQVFKFTQH